MREFTTSPLVAHSRHQNATDLLMHRFKTSPDHIAFEIRAADGAVTDRWRQVSTREFVDEVRALAKGFIAADLQPGDSLAIMSPTRYEWALADMAAWFAGAVVVPIYETSSLEQVMAILLDTRVRFAIAGTSDEASILERAFDQVRIPDGRVWTMDTRAHLDLADLIEDGKHVADSTVEERRLLATLESTATIVYTSGTTAAPKGAVITHGNFVGQVVNVAAAYTQVVKESGNTVIFLPLAHVLARGLQLTCLASGMRIAHLADTREVVPSLAALSPTFLVVVPRVLQKIQIAAATAAAQKHLGPLWRSARDTAIEWGQLAETREANSAAKSTLGLRLRHAIFDRLFYARLRKVVGGRLDYLLSGAAALDAELSYFFRGIDLPVIEGYGLTETTAPLTGNLPGSVKSGSVGFPMPGTTIRLSDDGEVLARGVGIFSGYTNSSDNKDAFTDGFFRTGDLGEFDEQGRLTLKGRIKDVIVTANGKTISPTIWEGYVENDPLIAHAVMVGEGKPFLGGLVLLDPESIQEWATREGITHVARLRIPDDGGAIEIEDERLREAIVKAVGAANAKIARSEQVRKFVVLLTDLSESNGIITPTMKLKREKFIERSSFFVEKIYADAMNKS